MKLATAAFRIFIYSLLAAALLGCAGQDAGTKTPTKRAPGPITPGEVEEFADNFFSEQIDELQIPGLTFAFVQDGQILYTGGYGSANIDDGAPVVPGETVMRVGSTSKLFVATAVMQLVERGELDLHTDVNKYLRALKLDENFQEPVTLAHLLTHTGGFDHPPYWTTTDPSEVAPLGPNLAEQMPPRINPPDEVLAYSSEGYDLAAYIVEEISGLPFDQYVERHILQPLEMERSGYLLNPPMPEGMAVGYARDGRSQIPQPMDYDPGYPSGSFVSTASDMARFMQAHLGEGCYQDKCILEPESIRLMHEQQFTNHPQLGGWTYGFTEGVENKQRWIGHGGAIRGFGSDLTLLPEHNLGYFFAFNEECWQTGACQITRRFREQFFDHFFPYEPMAPPDYSPATDLAELAGKYRHIRYPHSDMYDVDFSPFDINVTKDHDQLLIDEVGYQEIAPLVFQEVDGSSIIAFRRGEQGIITHLFMFSSEAFEKLDQ